MKWYTPALGQVATITGGSTPRRNKAEYWNGAIPWLTPTDLPMPGEGIADVIDTSSKITQEGLAATSAQLLPVGTVLFSSRATIGKLGISRVPLATNQGFANFIPKRFVDAKYLAYCLLHHKTEITALAGSTTFKEVTKTALKKFRVPLPPLSEQRRIVEILDQADALRKKRAEADAKAARILPALFYRMFGEPSTNPKGWPVDP
ncbi:MAG: restriction endonuclease subunit S [Syntrophales bacterium]|jgi:type I restriction enzyme S subunit|nr:restriction endonuclease subunit S [Syntrophales bacterium]MDY0045454.1 restriction endonuclease subunit S [Syntrophales bacterium]